MTPAIDHDYHSPVPNNDQLQGRLEALGLDLSDRDTRLDIAETALNSDEQNWERCWATLWLERPDLREPMNSMAGREALDRVLAKKEAEAK